MEARKESGCGEEGGQWGLKLGVRCAFCEFKSAVMRPNGSVLRGEVSEDRGKTRNQEEEDNSGCGAKFNHYKAREKLHRGVWGRITQAAVNAAWFPGIFPFRVEKGKSLKFSTGMEGGVGGGVKMYLLELIFAWKPGCLVMP